MTATTIAPHTSDGSSADGSESLADVAERLFAVFESRLDLPTIIRVVRRCRRELDIVSGPPLPELLERLAHQRLTDLAAARRAQDGRATAYERRCV